jgi:hypothetical protein
VRWAANTSGLVDAGSLQSRLVTVSKSVKTMLQQAKLAALLWVVGVIQIQVRC